jgi:hypothetical protein
VSLEAFQEMTGLELCGEGGELLERLPPIHRWLNRILALRIATQNSIFEEFLGLVEDRVEAARTAGTLDLGIETIRADRMDLLSDQLLRTDPVTGAETRLLRLELHRRPPITSWAMLQLECKDADDIAWLRNARSGRVALRVPTWPGQDEGQLDRAMLSSSPTGQSRMEVAALSASHWSEIERDTFQLLWEQEAAEAGRIFWSRQLRSRPGCYCPSGTSCPKMMCACGVSTMTPACRSWDVSSIRPPSNGSKGSSGSMAALPLVLKKSSPARVGVAAFQSPDLARQGSCGFRLTTVPVSKSATIGPKTGPG